MKSRSLAALSVSVVFAISGIPAYAGEAEADRLENMKRP